MHNSALKCTRTYTSTLAREVLFCCLNFINAVKNVSVSLIYLLWELLREFISKKITLNTFWLYVFLCLWVLFLPSQPNSFIWFLIMINGVPTNWLVYLQYLIFCNILTGDWETISEIKKSEAKCLTRSVFEDMYGIFAEQWKMFVCKHLCSCEPTPKQLQKKVSEKEKVSELINMFALLLAMSLGVYRRVQLPHIQQREESWMGEGSCWRRKRVPPLVSKTRAGVSGSTTGPLKRGRGEKERKRVFEEGKTQ